MNKKKSIIFTIYIFVASLFFGCGDKPQADLPTDSEKSIVGSSNYIINGATTFEAVTDVKGIVMKATTVGGTESVAGFAIEKNDVRLLADAAGGYVTTEELRAIVEVIKAEDYVNDDFSTINEQFFTKYSEFSVGDYKFSTPQATTALDLSNNMLNTLASTTLTLTAGSGVSATAFRMFVTVTDFNDNYYYTLSISPDTNETDIFVENLSLMKALSSGTNFTGLNERLVSTTDTFSGLANNGNQADFLFMIDDSGSMGDQQIALTAAANDFERSINLAGMNYNIAILTTSDGADGVPCTENCYDRSVNSVGIIDNNITMFKSEVDDINTSGNPTETGIYNSEQALQSTNNGDSTDGLLLPLGFPRDNTQLSVIILSDEVSQYTYRAAGAFDVTDNLFVRDNILVNSIVDTGLCGTNSFYEEGVDTNGQYDDLANETGGLVGNICNGGDTPDFNAVMQNIVLQAAGAYKLSNRYVKPNSLKVIVDGVESSPSIKNGYIYIEGTNSIAFFGTLPVEGAKIEIYYEYPKDINLFEND
ncbi:MAG: hypothetical protein ACI9TV_000793 [Sulfurimonas sp.]|jgi:hypothetical protein|uniref:hypothetical protein n=1 Tax=Sulfurimonas sp. TaxID=2022749 RepID=UPI0039E2DE07